VIRFRKRLTLRRLAAVPIIVGVTFAVGSWGHAPWQTCALNAGLFVLPVFTTGPTLFQWIVFYGVAGVLVGLAIPPVVTHRSQITVFRTLALPSVVPPVRSETR
jgi:hypothetical protein